jgi:transcription elongation factor Elf1
MKNEPSEQGFKCFNCGEDIRSCICDFDGKEDKVKFECSICGCYFWVNDRNTFQCPNCEYLNEVKNGFKS